MSRHCILHIGMHKTGTSSIQATLFHNREYLLKTYGVYYPGAHMNHGYLAAGYVDKPEAFLPSIHFVGYQLEARLSWAENCQKKILALVQDQTIQTLVLSGEAFSMLTLEEAKRFITDIKKGFDQIDVHIYVREPYGFASSAAQQKIKAGATRENIDYDTLTNPTSFPKERSLNKPDFCVLPRYRFRIEKYQTLVGRKNVHIHSFEKDRFKGGDVVQDFLSVALKIDDNQIDLETSNEGLDSGMVEVLEAINRDIGATTVKGRPNLNRARALTAPLRRQAKNKFALHDFDRDRFKALNQPDTDWLRNITRGSIDFSNSNPPMTPKSEIDLTVVADVLNAQALKAEQFAIQAQMFRAFWRFEKGELPERDMHARDIEAIIMRCWEPAFLLNVAYNLLEMKSPELARSALDRIEILTDDIAQLHKAAGLKKRASSE